MEKVSKISIIILIIFMINNVTYLSIDYLNIIYKYSSTARGIYLFLIFPLNLIGMILIILSVYKFIMDFRNNLLNLLIALLLFVYYIYFYKWW